MPWLLLFEEDSSMGLFGGKKQPKANKQAEQDKPTTARRSRRIVQPGAAKSAATPGSTKERSPEPKVKRPFSPAHLRQPQCRKSLRP